jgi:hypothetical protein
VTLFVGHGGVTAFKAVSVVTQERARHSLQELNLPGAGVHDAGLVHLKTTQALKRLDPRESVAQIIITDNQCQNG